jgi:hypothetical protein
MSRHTTYRGVTVDMDSMRRENEKVPAVGNMHTNAKGDQIKGGVVTKTADQIARERGRVQSVLVNSGLKGSMPEVPASAPVSAAVSAPVAKEKASPVKKAKEKELPSGDIVVEEDNGNTGN